jgi:hypothetical protein
LTHAPTRNARLIPANADSYQLNCCLPLMLCIPIPKRKDQHAPRRISQEVERRTFTRRAAPIVRPLYDPLVGAERARFDEARLDRFGSRLHVLGPMTPTDSTVFPGQEVHFHLNGTVGHHDLSEEDEGLAPSNVPMPEEMFADRLVADFGDPPMVQGQVDIRTADLPRLGEWQEQLQYSSPNYHDS